MERITKRLQQILENKPKLKFLTRKNKKGFTLVELIVNMAIIGIIMVMVTTITNMSLGSFRTHKQRLDAVNVGDLIITTIENKINKVGHAKLEKFFEPVVILNELDEVVGWKDLNADGVPDTTIRNYLNEEYPVCLTDIQNYTIIYLEPDKKTTTNTVKNALTSVNRKGKLYTIKSDKNIKKITIDVPEEHGYGIEGYAVDGNGKDLFVEPLLDEKLYKGYLVDVRFQYVSVHDNSKDDIIIGKLNAPGGESTDTGTTPGENTETGGSEGSGGTEGSEGTEGGGEPELEPELDPKPPEPDLDGSGNVDGAPVGRLNCIKVIVDVYDGDSLVHTSEGTITFIQRFFKMDSPYGDYVGDKSVLLIRA